MKKSGYISNLHFSLMGDEILKPKNLSNKEQNVIFNGLILYNPDFV